MLYKLFDLTILKKGERTLVLSDVQIVIPQFLYLQNRVSISYLVELWSVLEMMTIKQEGDEYKALSGSELAVNKC